MDEVSEELYIDLELSKSIVRTELLEHIKHNNEFKKTNLFLNLISMFSRNFLTILSFVFIVFYFFLPDMSFVHVLKYFSLVELATAFSLSYVTGVSVIIIVREVFIFFMRLIYGDKFDKGLILTNKNIISIAEKLGKINNTARNECLEIINVRENQNNLIYRMFTEGNNKRLIDKFIDLEIRFRVLKEISHKKDS